MLGLYLQKLYSDYPNMQNQPINFIRLEIIFKIFIQTCDAEHLDPLTLLLFQEDRLELVVFD